MGIESANYTIVPRADTGALGDAILCLKTVRALSGFPRAFQKWVVQAVRQGLTLLVDLCTRTIVGWFVSECCDAALALRALNNAVARHQPDTGLLHHTERGATYRASDYRARLSELGMMSSMSHRGNCWDNAVAE